MRWVADASSPTRTRTALAGTQNMASSRLREVRKAGRNECFSTSERCGTQCLARAVREAFAAALHGRNQVGRATHVRTFIGYLGNCPTLLEQFVRTLPD